MRVTEGWELERGGVTEGWESEIGGGSHREVGVGSEGGVIVGAI